MPHKNIKYEKKEDEIFDQKDSCERTFGVCVWKIETCYRNITYVDLMKKKDMVNS